MKKLRLILDITAMVLLLGAVGFAMIVKPLSALASDLVIGAAALCIIVSLGMKTYERKRNGEAYHLWLGATIGAAITLILNLFF